MKKTTRIFTTAAFIWAAYMLFFFVFLSMCVELQWDFIYELPAAADWILRNIFSMLFIAGRFGTPALTGAAVILTVIFCTKEKSIKSVDMPLLVTTVIFTVTASIIAAIDTSILATFS